MPEGDQELQDLYREVLLDYFRSGSHKGVLDDADVRPTASTPCAARDRSIDRTSPGRASRIASVRSHGLRDQPGVVAMMAEALEGCSVTKARSLVPPSRT